MTAMAELEIHHEIEGEADPAGKQVGLLAAILAVILAIVTILSHAAIPKRFCSRPRPTTTGSATSRCV